MMMMTLKVEKDKGKAWEKGKGKEKGEKIKEKRDINYVHNKWLHIIFIEV